MRRKGASKYPFRRNKTKEQLVAPSEPCDEEKYGTIEDGIWYPNKDFVEDTHILMLERYGGFTGYERGIDVFDTILEDARKTEDMFRKAAIFLYDICGKRMFKDGNHRTAIVTTRTFLVKNGMNLGTNDPEKIYKFVKSIAYHSVDDIEKWIKYGSVEESSVEDP